MKTLSTMLKAFWQEESGLTMVEYAVAGTLVSLAAVTAFTNLGTAISTNIQGIANIVSPAA